MATNLPYLQSDDTVLNKLQNLWRAILNPLIAVPMSSGLQLSIKLAVGENAIPHLLSRTQQGWFVVDQNAKAAFYRSRPFNGKFLYLTSDAIVTVSLWVY